jgi:hypothetical protein
MLAGICQTAAAISKPTSRPARACHAGRFRIPSSTRTVAMGSIATRERKRQTVPDRCQQLVEHLIFSVCGQSRRYCFCRILLQRRRFCHREVMHNAANEFLEETPGGGGGGARRSPAAHGHSVPR